MSKQVGGSSGRRLASGVTVMSRSARLSTPGTVRSDRSRPRTPIRFSMPSLGLGQLTASISQFANERGVYLGRRSTKIHVALYRRTGGKIGGHLPGWPDARILLVDHKGAKSGTKRTSPLMYLEDGDVFAVVASKAGQPTNPGWFYNLRANPDTAIQVGSVVRQVRTRSQLIRIAIDSGRNSWRPIPDTTSSRATPKAERFRS